MIRLQGVGKTYPGGTVAVHELDLDVPRGELVTLVGPSGCGKSTTLRMIAGLETVSEGSIRIGEREVTALEPKDRNVAMVFQNYALYAHKSVYDNLGFGLKVRGTPRAEIDQRVRRAADTLGIADLLQRKP
ncbi:MAG: ABC transporter ATP-binding protein, partial [Nocardioidaceae bacterium]